MDVPSQNFSEKNDLSVVPLKLRPTNKFLMNCKSSHGPCSTTPLTVKRQKLSDAA